MKWLPLCKTWCHPGFLWGSRCSGFSFLCISLFVLLFIFLLAIVYIVSTSSSSITASVPSNVFWYLPMQWAPITNRDRCGQHRIVVGLVYTDEAIVITTYWVVLSFIPDCDDVHTKHLLKCNIFVCDLWQFGGFLRVLRSLCNRNRLRIIYFTL